MPTHNTRPVVVPKGCHLIEVNREHFGYTLTHELDGKLLFTGTYETEADALRSATRLAHARESRGEHVMFCVNSAFR